VIDTFVAHRTEEDRIRLGQLNPYLVGDGDAVAEVSVRVDVELLELVVGARGAQDLDRLRNDLLPRSVTGQDGYVLGHRAGLHIRPSTRSASTAIPRMIANTPNNGVSLLKSTTP
jgi:hypothetical protein